MKRQHFSILAFSVLALAPLAVASGSGALTGRWTTTHVSSIQYRNTVTGAPRPTSGTTFTYEFEPDGTYSFTGLMQSTMYNCTTATFSHEQGSWSLDGGILHLRPVRNPYKMTNSCAPSSNREAPGKLINKDYRVRVVQDGQKQKLELISEDGATQAFWR